MIIPRLDQYGTGFSMQFGSKYFGKLFFEREGNLFCLGEKIQTKNSNKQNKYYFGNIHNLPT